MGLAFTWKHAWLPLLITFQLCSATPNIWWSAQVRTSYNIVLPQSPSCVDHPTSDVGAPSPHGSPAIDSATSFAFFDSATGGAVSDTLCPGSTYRVTVSFGGSTRLGLLTADPPLATFTSPAATSGCSNRVDLGGSQEENARSSYDANFTVPCAAAGTSITFKVTSVNAASGAVRTWQQNSAQVAVASLSATTGTCAAAIAACNAPPATAPECSNSSLGYQCSRQWRNVTIHWSINTTAAPANPCTPSSPTVLTAQDVAQYGTIHMAVQAVVPGYVAVGFAPNPGKMMPSDVILGYASTTGTAPTASVQTFHVSTRASLSAGNNNTAGTWAYDTGVIEEAATGTTTICFSRRMLEPRAPATPDLRSSTNRLGLNWAVSPNDSVVAHRRGSVGGFWLDLAGSTPTGDKPQGEDKAEDKTDNKDLDSTASPPPPPPPPAASVRTCAPSSLGYECSVKQGKVTVHWSVNKPSAPAGNGCTPAILTTLLAEEITRYGALHVAVQGAVPGYVGLGFNSNPDHMYPSDIFMGWATGSSGPYTNTFYVTGNGLTAGDVYPSDGSPSWAYDRGVTYDASSGVTTVCFSRRLLDSRAKVSVDLRSAVGAVGASAASGRRRLLQTAAGSGAPQLSLIWAVSTVAGIQQHTDENAGGFYLDVNSGATAAPGGRSKSYWINVHGALMAVAWGLLLPLGTLLPAHRWLFGSPDSAKKVAGKDPWFVAHLACQLTGMALFVAGFVVAFTKLEEQSDPDNGIGNAHENIGIAIMAAAGFQVVLAFVRPAPDNKRFRPAWNLVHHNLGRLTVLLAWANVYIGIYLYHVSPWAASYVEWITPIAIVMGLLVISDVLLRLFGPKPSDPAVKADPVAGPTNYNSGAADGTSAYIRTNDGA